MPSTRRKRAEGFLPLCSGLAPATTHVRGCDAPHRFERRPRIDPWEHVERTDFAPRRTGSPGGSNWRQSPAPNSEKVSASTAAGLYALSASRPAMSSNKQLVEAHMGAGPAKTAELLTDDFEWIEWADGVPPGGARTRGRAAFVQNFGDDALQNDVKRVIEEGNVVVVEGIAHVAKKDCRKFDVQYCNIFELEDRKVKRKSSYGALIKDAA